MGESLILSYLLLFQLAARGREKKKKKKEEASVLLLNLSVKGKRQNARLLLRLYYGFGGRKKKKGGEPPPRQSVSWIGNLDSPANEHGNEEGKVGDGDLPAQLEEAGGEKEREEGRCLKASGPLPISSRRGKKGKKGRTSDIAEK